MKTVRVIPLYKLELTLYKWVQRGWMSLQVIPTANRCYDTRTEYRRAIG